MNAVGAAGSVRRGPVRLVVTVDTEEDDWGHVRRPSYRCRNIGRVPVVQELFDAFGVVPTYLVTYPVATDVSAVSFLRRIADRGACEIGAHCHPWNTPPFVEADTRQHSMLANLPRDLQYAKIKCLHYAIVSSFSVEPRLFKAGRFSYDVGVGEVLQQLAYRIDTSVTPYTSWAWAQGPDFTDIGPGLFRISNNHDSPNTMKLVEVPVSIGFLQRGFARRQRILQAVGRSPLRRLGMRGLLDRLGLVSKAWLSPELADGRTMIRLARAMTRDGYRVLNLTFHSPSLLAGLTPYTRTHADERRLLARLEKFLTFARREGIEPARLSELEHLV
jgi:hypothetical protein